MKEELILIKTFFDCFDINYGMGVSNVVKLIDKIGNIDLYKDEKVIGKLSYDNGIYNVFAKLPCSNLVATITTDFGEKRFTKLIDYELSIDGDNKIKGIYKVNNNGNNCKPDLRNKKTIKNAFSILKNGEELSYFKFFTIRNYTYIVDRVTDEYINFNNDVLSHGVDGKYTHVGYDFNNDFINYSYFFKEEEQPLVYTGGYKLYKDSEEKDFSLIRKEYRKTIDEFDPRYIEFIEEQRKLVDEFSDGLFDKFINRILSVLSEKEKTYIFKLDNGPCKKIVKFT